MNTESPNPDHEELKALLANSFHSEEGDDVPPLPDDLRDRIRDQYGKAKTPEKAPSEERSESFFAKISRLFAQPAFSGAAAALVLVAVAAILLFPKHGTRGDQDYTGVKVVLIGFEAEQAKAIAKNLDPRSVKIVDDLANQISEDGHTIVIDGSDREIEGFSGPGNLIKTVPLPDTPAAIAYEVATMSAALRK